MKDSLKDFVDSNRPAFDDREPSDKVWSRIDAALPVMKTRSLWNSVVIWRVAAILFFGLSAYLWATRTTPSSVRLEAKSQGEFTDLESFYSGQIAEKVALINDFDGTGDEEQFTQDFQKLEAMYQVLREEMKTRPGEKVKDALVLNLLVRIDLLNQQLKKLEDSKGKGKKPKESVV